MALARALRNGAVAFVISYAVASRVGGDRESARRVAAATGVAVLLVSLLRGRTRNAEPSPVEDPGRASAVP